MPHPDLHPYPDVFPMAAAQIVVDTIRRTGNHDTACLAHAGWAVAGYALGQLLPDDHLMQSAPLTAESLADYLENQVQRREGVALAIPWRQVALFVLTLVNEWLRK